MFTWFSVRLTPAKNNIYANTKATHTLANTRYLSLFKYLKRNIQKIMQCRHINDMYPYGTKRHGSPLNFRDWIVKCLYMYIY